MTTGDTITALLRDRDLTPTQLAAKVGISRASMYRLLAGERDPRQSELNLIALTLKVSVADLTEREVA